MGVRLYVESTKPEEFFVDAPEGTGKILDVFEARCPQGSTPEAYEAYDAWHKEMEAVKGCSDLYYYRLTGFGKLSEELFRYIKAHGFDSDCGQTSDPVHVKAIIQLHGRVPVKFHKHITKVIWN